MEMLTLSSFKLQSFIPRHSNRRRECVHQRERKGIKKVPSERGFPGQSPFTHRALTLPAEPEAGRVMVRSGMYSLLDFA